MEKNKRTNEEEREKRKIERRRDWEKNGSLCRKKIEQALTTYECNLE